MDLDSIQPRPTGHQPTTVLRTMDGNTITIKHGDANEPLQGNPLDAIERDERGNYDVHNIHPADAESAIFRLATFAFANFEDAHAYTSQVCFALSIRPTIGALLSNRIYRDRIDCPDTA